MTQPAALPAITPALLSAQFSRCLSPDPSEVRNAEESLLQASVSPSFILALLRIIEQGDTSESIRLIAAIYFKNYLRKNWDKPDDAGGVQKSDRELIREKICYLMIAATSYPRVQSQLSSSIQLIASVDFPNDWPGLISDLTQSHLLSGNNTVAQKCGAMEVVASVVDKYRTAERSDDILRELKFNVLPPMELALLPIFTESLARWREDKMYFTLLSLSVRIFLALHSVDLPEYFENNKLTFLEGLLKLLDFESSELSGDSDETEGPLEETKSEVCKVLTLYAQRYAEEFEEVVVVCVSRVMDLLQRGPDGPHLDGVVSSGISFLGAAARVRWESNPITDDVLNRICRGIVVENIQLRDSDMEMLEDNPQEFVRRTLEGAEGATRRESAVELVKSLSVLYEEKISQILPSYVVSLLQAAEGAESARMKDKLKDAAVYLVVALAVKTQTRQWGVSQVNAKIDIQEFFTLHLRGELVGSQIKAATNGSVPVEARPANIFVVCSTLKFIALFRNQFSKELLLETLPHILRRLSSPNPVVHTHASYCIECLLSAREVPTPASQNNGELAVPAAPVVLPNPAARKIFKFSRTTLSAPLIEALSILTRLVSTPGGIQENEYLMRCIWKVLVFLQTEALSVVLPTLDVLVALLKREADSCSNPQFAHLLFEAVATCCKIAALSGKHQEAESKTLEVLAKIVVLGDHDFTPYALQLMGLLLDTAAAASPLYVQLFDHLLAVDRWTTSTAAVPGIVRVLVAFFRKHAIFGEVLKSNMETIMVRFKYCINHKRLVSTAFQLLNDIICRLPVEFYKAFAHPIVLTILERLRAGKTEKVSAEATLSLALLFCKYSDTSLPAILNAIQPGLAANFLMRVYLPQAEKVTKRAEKKVCIVSVAGLCTTPEVLNSNEILNPCMEALAKLMGIVTDVSRPKQLTELDEDEEDLKVLSMGIAGHETSEFQGTYNSLASVRLDSSTSTDIISDAEVAPLLRKILEQEGVQAKAAGLPSYQSVVGVLRNQG